MLEYSHKHRSIYLVLRKVCLCVMKAFKYVRRRLFVVQIYGNGLFMCCGHKIINTDFHIIWEVDSKLFNCLFFITLHIWHPYTTSFVTLSTYFTQVSKFCMVYWSMFCLLSKSRYSYINISSCMQNKTLEKKNKHTCYHTCWTDYI